MANKHSLTQRLYWIALGVIPHFASAQDTHYTNFNGSPLHLSPALTGAFRGDARYGGSFRSQWQSVPVGYTTFTGFADAKIGKNPLDYRPFRIGATFSYDQAGDAGFNNLSLALAGAYALQLSKSHFLTAGVSVGGTQRRFNKSDLAFSDQYVSGQFQSQITTQEPIANQKGSYFDVNLGLNYSYQAVSDRTLIQIGAGYYHLNKPTFSFANDAGIQIKPRLATYLSSVLQLSRRWDLLVDVAQQNQRPHTELIGSLGGRFHLDLRRTRPIALQTGIAFRNGDATAPFFGILYHQWQATLHYDINFSKFKSASSTIGGPEMNLIYTFNKVLPKTHCPLCPKYL